MDINSINLRGTLHNPSHSGSRYSFTLKVDKESIRCVAWNQIATEMANSFKQGDKVEFEGYISINGQYTNITVRRICYPCLLSIQEWYDKGCKEIDANF